MISQNRVIIFCFLSYILCYLLLKTKITLNLHRFRIKTAKLMFSYSCSTFNGYMFIFLKTTPFIGIRNETFCTMYRFIPLLKNIKNQKKKGEKISHWDFSIHRDILFPSNSHFIQF